MNKEKFDIEDMALEGNEKTEKLDMELSPSPSEIEAKIKEIFPNEDVIEIEPGFKLSKMMAGNYLFNDATSLKDLTTEDLNKIDDFLKSRG